MSIVTTRIRTLRALEKFIATMGGNMSLHVAVESCMIRTYVTYIIIGLVQS